MREWHRWLPASLLIAGALLNSTLIARRAGTTPLAGDITTVATTMLGVPGVDMPVSDDEARVAGFTEYMRRDYALPDGTEFGLYMGYYDEQRQGKTIHSPRNCLPGAGWDPVGQSVITIDTDNHGQVGINRYELVNGQARAIVYYWYQGRGRIAHNEYLVKYELLRDAAVHGRTEEALVRIVVPVKDDNVAAADELAMRIAPTLAGEVDRVLPKL